MSRYDLIVIGGGHNGLTTACYAAKAGRKVLVLEQHDKCGGLAAAEEFHPGFFSPGVHHETSHVRDWVVKELGLEQHGLRRRTDDVPVLITSPEKGYLLWDNPERASEEFSAETLKSYREYRGFLNKISPFVRSLFDGPPLQLTKLDSNKTLWDLAMKGLGLRKLGKAEMMDILRILPMCSADWLQEYFADPLLTSGLSIPSVRGTFMGPWSPGSNTNLLINECLRQAPVVGGPAQVTAALVRCAESLGIEVRTNATVKEVLCSEEKVTGVLLEDGEKYEAAKVAASCDPQTLFFKLINPLNLDLSLEENVRNVRLRGTTAKVHLALKDLPEWKSKPGVKADYIRTCGHLDTVEKAFDPVKYKEYAKDPVLECFVPSIDQPDCAPQGQHVMSVMVHFAPYDLKEGWNDKSKAGLTDAVMKKLEEHAPGLKDKVIASETLTPKDIEDRYQVTGGQIFHGEHAIDQWLVRPFPQAANFATPIAGLYLCGSGAHPGGGVTCAPGALAAKVLLG